MLGAPGAPWTAGLGLVVVGLPDRGLGAALEGGADGGGGGGAHGLIALRVSEEAEGGLSEGWGVAFAH